MFRGWVQGNYKETENVVKLNSGILKSDDEGGQIKELQVISSKQPPKYFKIKCSEILIILFRYPPDDPFNTTYMPLPGPYSPMYALPIIRENPYMEKRSDNVDN